MSQKNEGFDPSFRGLVRSATCEDGSISSIRFQLNEGLFGHNGGQPCDVLDGPCSCGAMHRKDEKVQEMIEEMGLEAAQALLTRLGISF
mgnify:CR=1 FL=1